MWIDDWLSSTEIAQMTAGEERGYLRLLLHAWKPNPATGKPPCALPNDDRALASMARLTEEEWQRSGTVLRRQFRLIGGGHWLRNQRQWKEWQAMVRQTALKREAGRKGGQRSAARRSQDGRHPSD
jgi:uncharacterized protein YdaU (DUF1376 family)